MRFSCLFWHHNMTHEPWNIRYTVDGFHQDSCGWVVRGENITLAHSSLGGWSLCGQCRQSDFRNDLERLLDFNWIMACLRAQWIGIALAVCEKWLRSWSSCGVFSTLWWILPSSRRLFVAFAKWSLAAVRHWPRGPNLWGVAPHVKGGPTVFIGEALHFGADRLWVSEVMEFFELSELTFFEESAGDIAMPYQKPVSPLQFTRLEMFLCSPGYDIRARREWREWAHSSNGVPTLTALDFCPWSSAFDRRTPCCIWRQRRKRTSKRGLSFFAWSCLQRWKPFGRHLQQECVRRSKRFCKSWLPKAHHRSVLLGTTDTFSSKLEWSKVYRTARWCSRSVLQTGSTTVLAMVRGLVVQNASGRELCFAFWMIWSPKVWLFFHFGSCWSKHASCRQCSRRPRSGLCRGAPWHCLWDFL